MPYFKGMGTLIMGNSVKDVLIFPKRKEFAHEEKFWFVRRPRSHINCLILNV